VYDASPIAHEPLGSIRAAGQAGRYMMPIAWKKNIDTAIEEAKLKRKALLLDFTAAPS
jgi:hypothetical protein